MVKYIDGIVETRSVDRILIFAFSVLSSFYFIVSVVLAWKYASDEFGGSGKYIVAIAYLVVGIALAIILYSQAQTDTKLTAPPAEIEWCRRPADGGMIGYLRWRVEAI